MSRPRMRTGIRTSLATLAFPLFVGAPARAEVAEIALKDLIAHSDLIVVVTVTKIEPAPDIAEHVAAPFRPVKVATARVVETWKGAAVREVRFVASPTWTCDTADAREGEKLVLFLDRHGNAPTTIAHAGRGGMSIRDVEGKPHATLSNQVILPEGTKTISETKKRRMTFPAAPPQAGKKGNLVVDYTYEERSIDLETLHALVRQESRRVIDARRPAASPGR